MNGLVGHLQSLVERAGTAYIAGPSINEAREVCAQFAARRIAVTLCYWNRSSDHPDTVCEKYLSLLDLMRDLTNDSYLSLKAPALRFDFQLVRTVLRRAEQTNTIVHFDSLAPETVEPTFALINEARNVYPNLGCTLPFRWRRSIRDASFAAVKGLRVRVVRGQWAGSWGEETNSFEGCSHLIRSLIANEAPHVAIATHNSETGAYALDTLKSAGVPCELELLYGLQGEAMTALAHERNSPIRVYVACGHGGLPYRLREVHRDPRILLWFMRDLIRSA